jgi:hypothetical protein
MAVSDDDGTAERLAHVRAQRRRHVMPNVRQLNSCRESVRCRRRRLAHC